MKLLDVLIIPKCLAYANFQYLDDKLIYAEIVSKSSWMWKSPFLAQPDFLYLDVKIPHEQIWLKITLDVNTPISGTPRFSVFGCQSSTCTYWLKIKHALIFGIWQYPSSSFRLALCIHGLFLVPASAPRLVQQRLWYVLSYLWDGAYKRTLAVNRKE